MSTRANILSTTTGKMYQGHVIANNQAEAISSFGGKKSLIYYDKSHIQVLTQMHGSVWKRVLPFCILNCIIAIVIYIHDLKSDFFSMSDKGHIFMSLMVSYLVISRLSNSLHRYMDASKHLFEIMGKSRELIQQAVAFTRYGMNRGPKGMQWRIDVAKRLVSLLRSIESYLQKESTGKNFWEQRGLTELEIKAMLLAVGKSNERAPYALNIFLRSVIAAHEHKLDPPLEVVQELYLLKITSDIISAYGRIIKDVNTPYPFPMVQMTRTFLFVYVFSLPLALLNDIGKLAPLLFVVFFLTYGFLGLELVAVEMDDPYGDDDNDFCVWGLASVVYNDIAVCLHDIDGKEAVDRLKRVSSGKQPKKSFKKNKQTNGHFSRRGQCSTDRDEMMNMPEQSDRQTSLPNGVLRNCAVLLPNRGEIQAIVPKVAIDAKLAYQPGISRFSNSPEDFRASILSTTIDVVDNSIVVPSINTARGANEISSEQSINSTDSISECINSMLSSSAHAMSASFNETSNEMQSDDDLSSSGSSESSSDISYNGSLNDFVVSKCSNNSISRAKTHEKSTNLIESSTNLVSETTQRNPLDQVEQSLHSAQILRRQHSIPEKDTEQNNEEQSELN